MQQNKPNSDYKPEETYEYELPGQPRKKDDETLAESFFSQPSDVPPDAKPLNPNKRIDKNLLRPWYIASAIMLILCLIFEFGILGKDGKEGPVCSLLPKNSICKTLAGSPPSK